MQHAAALMLRGGSKNSNLSLLSLCQSGFPLIEDNLSDNTSKITIKPAAASNWYSNLKTWDASDKNKKATETTMLSKNETKIL